MSAVTHAPPAMIRLHRAPLLDPPFDDELSPQTYRPEPVDERFVLPPSALAGASPEAHQACLRFLNFGLEVLNGFRTPAQLRQLIEPETSFVVLEELTRVMHLATEMRRRTNDSKLRRSTLRVCEPITGAAEAAAVLASPTRTFAVAYRLEKRTPSWKCAFLKFLL
ncbi:Rv3235 family protein [Catelliglobosispora koreensis]|uniref:Rv3235 family protein n=1 Tax=Catelliglobosispora koreensis TaxID=129052 RepID=UPI00035CC437|nr:Rv3235 family protein [Catelliglobosispora koreensis]